jgi:hypothetical protein
MTFSIMTFNITRLSTTLCHYDECRILFIYFYAECPFTECSYAECSYAERSYAERSYAEWRH